MNEFNEEDAPVKCLRCSSTQVYAENVSADKFHGGDQIVITCLKCGSQFKPGQQMPPLDTLNVHPFEKEKDLYVTCPTCGKLSSTACYVCPKCGRKFLQEDLEKATKIKRTGCLPVIIIGVVIALSIWLLT